MQKQGRLLFHITINISRAGQASLGFCLLTFTFLSLIFSGSGQDEHKIPAQQQALSVAVDGDNLKNTLLLMKFSEKEDLNKTLTIIDACQVDALIDFSFNLPADFYDLTNPSNSKGLSLKKYVDQDFKIKLTQENKLELINVLADNFEEGEIYHYTFFHDKLKIGEGFDHCEINFLDPKYFVFTQSHVDNLADDVVNFKEIVQ